MNREIFLRYKYDKIIYVYMLIRYWMHNILPIMVKNRDITIFIYLIHIIILIINNYYYKKVNIF